MTPVDIIIPFASEQTDPNKPAFAYYNRADVRHTPDAIMLDPRGAHGFWLKLRERLLPLLPEHGKGTRIIAWQYGGWRKALDESEAVIDALARARRAGADWYSPKNTRNFAEQVYADTGLWPAWYLGYAYPPQCRHYAAILERSDRYNLLARILGYKGDPREAAWHQQTTLDTRELSQLGPLIMDTTMGVHAESKPSAPWAWWAATWAAKEHRAGKVLAVEPTHREGMTILYDVPVMVTQEQMELADRGEDDSIRRDLPDRLITVRMLTDDPRQAAPHLARGRRVAIAPWGLIERWESIAEWLARAEA